jgi:hypothetical protein
MTKSAKTKLWWFAAAAFVMFCLICLALFSFGQNILYDRQVTLTSPANRMNQIWFYFEGDPFGDEIGYLYAEPKDQNKQYLAMLNDEGNFAFSYGQWTKDGQVFVCSFLIFNGGKTNDNPPVKAVAYDFSTGKITIPLWFDANHEEARSAFNWNEFESTIEKLIAAHGGLNDDRLDQDSIQKGKKVAWPWQIPKP